MPALTIAWFGDVVGKPGRIAFAHAAQHVCEHHAADIVIVNGENARHGHGLHPVGYEELRAAGADIITLGDHTLDDERILPILEDPTQHIAKPANITQWPNAKTRSTLTERTPPITVVTVLGLIFMRFESENPWLAIDREIEAAIAEHPDTLVLVEIHAEATSEKIATAWHCAQRWPDRVMAVVGTHTHVPTNDARLIDDRLAAITDLGMCGSSRSIIGFDIDSSLGRLRDKLPGALKIAEAEPVAQGVLITLDPEARRATDIQPLSVPAPPSK